MSDDKKRASTLFSRLGEHALEKFIGAIALALGAAVIGNYLEIWNVIICLFPWFGDGLVCGRP